jgi:hypothetical protein
VPQIQPNYNDPRYAAYKQWLEDRGMATFTAHPAKIVAHKPITQTIHNSKAHNGKVLFITDYFTKDGAWFEDSAQLALFERLVDAIGLGKDQFDMVSVEKDLFQKFDAYLVPKNTDFEWPAQYQFVVMLGHFVAMRSLGAQQKFEQLISAPQTHDDQKLYVVFHPRDLVRFPQHKVKTWNLLKQLKEQLQVMASTQQVSG